MATIDQLVVGRANVVGANRKARLRRGAATLAQAGTSWGGLVPLGMAGCTGGHRGAGRQPDRRSWQNELGLTALIFLLAALACTPARRLRVGPGRSVCAAS